MSTDFFKHIVNSIVASYKAKGWPVVDDLDDPGWVSPFDRLDWTGSVQSVDDTLAFPVPEDGLRMVLVRGAFDPAWDAGTHAGIALLKDGRWCAWETFSDVTGDGFRADAYGGDATIFVGASPEVLQARALTAEGRALCGIPLPTDIPEEPQ